MHICHFMTNILKTIYNFLENKYEDCLTLRKYPWIHWNYNMKLQRMIVWFIFNFNETIDTENCAPKEGNILSSLILATFGSTIELLWNRTINIQNIFWTYQVFFVCRNLMTNIFTNLWKSWLNIQCWRIQLMVKTRIIYSFFYSPVK